MSAHLCEPKERIGGLSGPPSRRGVRLGEGGLRLGEPKYETLACHGKVMVSFEARFVTIWGWFRDLICDVCGMLRRPLCDSFGSVIVCLSSDMFRCHYVCSNVSACIVLVCGHGHYC